MFGDDELEKQGFAALECLKQFMFVYVDTIPLVIVSVVGWWLYVFGDSCCVI